MPSTIRSKHSLNAQLRQMEKAIQAARLAAPGTLAAKLRDELEVQVEALRSLRVRHLRAVCEAKLATSRKNQSVQETRQAATRLRCCIMAILGPRNERLEDFGIKPLRTRRRPPLGTTGS